jgi:hypothetical protein
MDGKVLTGVFEEPLATRADEWVDTHDAARPSAAPAPALPENVDEQMLEHLRSLGYIGQ